MISFLTPLATDGISYAYGYVFVGMNLVGALVVWFFLYESVSLSLENVDLMYSQPGVKPWKSRSWVPPGYVTRLLKEDESETGGARSGSENGILEAQDKTRSSDVPGVEYKA